MVAPYLPLMITLNIVVYQFIRSIDKKSIGKRSYNLLLTSILCQVLKLMITLNIVVYQFISSVDKKSIGKRSCNLLLTSIPCQVNLVLNSVIYLSRWRHLKEYYYKLFNCKAVRNFFKGTKFSVAKGRLDIAERQVNSTI